MSAKPDQMQRLFDQIDAGNVSVKELPNALRQAGGPLMAIVAAVREMAACGGAAWGGITGTLSAQLDLQAALDAKAGLTANTFTRKQTVTQGTANEGILASTGYSLNGSNASNMLDFAGTWNTSGNPSALKIDITNTASGASALLADFRVGGVVKGSLTPTGLLSIADSLAFSGNSSTTPTRGFQSLSTADVSVITSGNRNFAFSGTQLYLLGGANSGFIVGPGELNLGNSSDTTLRAGGAGGVTPACLQMGTRSATPIAQTFQACPGIGSNIAGADFSILASNGTGTGGSGNIVFKTAPAAGSSSTPNTLAAILTIKGTGVLNVANIPTSAAGLVTGDVWSNLGILTVV